MRGPRCDRCGGTSMHGVKSRRLASQSETVYYLAYLWACSVCGHDWVDDGLERVNARAADEARLVARRAS